jgi:hypothetical protein
VTVPRRAPSSSPGRAPPTSSSTAPSDAGVRKPERGRVRAARASLAGARVRRPETRASESTTSGDSFACSRRFLASPLAASRAREKQADKKAARRASHALVVDPPPVSSLHDRSPKWAAITGVANATDTGCALAYLHAAHRPSTAPRSRDPACPPNRCAESTPVPLSSASAPARRARETHPSDSP